MTDRQKDRDGLRETSRIADIYRQRTDIQIGRDRETDGQRETATIKDRG